MSQYRHALPQLEGELFATDGGLETTLIYHEGLDLPDFASFTLMKDADGVAVLRRYFERYARIAAGHGVGIVLESPTWRANPDWGARLGYDRKSLDDVNRQSIELMGEVRRAFDRAETPVVLSGNLGPRGDGYVAARRMSAREACAYHAPQVETFADTAADMVAAFTMNYVEEAIGIARAAQLHAMPVAIAFTVETDGRLPSGQTLGDAIEQCDHETGAYAAYYMINCAHPTHFAHVLENSGSWKERIRGLRANASTRSHAELDASTDLDAGDPDTLAVQYRALREVLPRLGVVGGCCGTDHRHVDRICDVMLNALAPA